MAQKLGTLAIALAVLLVSATCTSAGCLLVSTPAAGAIKSCCAEHHPDHSTNHRGDDKCPLCHNSVLLVKGADKTAPISLTTCPILFAAFIPASPAVDSIHSLLQGNHHDPAPPSGPPTLLALHCALLI